MDKMITEQLTTIEIFTTKKSINLSGFFGGKSLEGSRNVSRKDEYVDPNLGDCIEKLTKNTHIS